MKLFDIRIMLDLHIKIFATCFHENKKQTYQNIHSSFSGSFQDKSPHVSALSGNEQAVSILLLCSIHFVLVHHSVSGVTFASTSKFD